MTPSALPRVAPRVALLVAGLVAIQAAAHLFVLHAHRSADLPVDVAFGVVFVDLTLTAASWAWWTLVRPGIVRAGAVVPIVALGLLVARLTLPVAVPVTLDGLAAGLFVAAEAAVGLTALRRLHTIRARWRSLRATGVPWTGALEAALSTALHPRLAAAVTTEVALIGLAGTGWFRRSPTAPDTFPALFTSQWPGLVGVLAFVALAEGAALHVLLAAAHPVLDAVHLVVVAYSLLWLAGDFHALRLMPTRIAAGHLHVHVGLRWSARVPLHQVAHAHTTTDTAADLDALDLTLPGGPTVLVVLATPTEVRGLFGIRRTTDRLLLSADEPDRLVRALES